MGAAFFLGSAATSTTAATTGLFGAGGVFSGMTTLGTLGTTIGALGALSSGMGSASIAKQNAALAQQQAAINASEKRKETQRLLSAQRAAYGASGVRVNTGTPVAFLSETAAQGELDALTTLYGGDAEASIYKRQASASATGGVIGAGASLLSGFGKE